MYSISLGRTGDPQMDPATLHGMFSLRHTVFKDRLGWDVDCREGLEIDRFDNLDPVYMVVRSPASTVDGCWRLLPTTGPYMLVDTFPELLRGEPAPREGDVWELSRFAVAPVHPQDRRQVSFSLTTFGMMQRVFEFGYENGIERYVTVTSVSLERMLRRIGVPLKRFGDGRATKIGKVLSVACWIEVNEQSRTAVYSVMETARAERVAA